MSDTARFGVGADITDPSVMGEARRGGSHVSNADLLAEYVVRHESTIVNALNVFANRMTEAAAEARAAYDAGQSDSEVKKAQDASTITNNGNLAAATLFTENAAKARSVATTLSDYIAVVDS